MQVTNIRDAKTIKSGEVALDSIEYNPENNVTRSFSSGYSKADRALQKSVAENGVIQPVVLVPGSKRGMYALVAGARRLEAAQKAKLETIPAVVKKLPATDGVRLGMIENLHGRQDPSPMEVAVAAKAYRELHEDGGRKVTNAELARVLGYTSTDSLANYERLLALPKPVQRKVHNGTLQVSGAFMLSSLPEELQAEVLGEAEEIEKAAITAGAEEAKQKLDAAEKKQKKAPASKKAEASVKTRNTRRAAKKKVATAEAVAEGKAPKVSRASVKKAAVKVATKRGDKKTAQKFAKPRQLAELVSLLEVFRSAQASPQARIVATTISKWADRAASDDKLLEAFNALS